jgi:hypothetical protein
LTQTPSRWRDQLSPRATPPRPTSIGTAGRLQSEWVADFRPESAADFVGIRSWSRCRRVVGKAEVTRGEANPQFVVTSLKSKEVGARYLYETVYCARGGMENRIKECQLDLFADRTSTATMRANQLRLWLASMAYVLLCAMRRIGLAHTQFPEATCGTIRLKLLKVDALVRISVRRIKVAMASACPYQNEFALAYARLRNAAVA